MFCFSKSCEEYISCINSFDFFFGDTVVKIDYLGKYDADKEIYPVIIKGKTGYISIAKTEAQALKSSFKLADVKCKKELNRDLKTYNFYDFVIIHPTTKTEYKFEEGVK